MNINRNNYEEYFLLYADKELSAADKMSVEVFVQQNPDLEEEFVMLQQSVLKPDSTILLEDKSGLFRKESFIDLTNYEEKFLLYTDNELNSSEIAATEKFVVNNPTLQNEFNLLQKVTYEPDTSIVFPDKKLLYRKEEETKVVPLSWRYLAAAILLGIGLWVGMPYLQKDKTVPEMVIKTQAPVKEDTPGKINAPKEVVKDPIVRTENGQQQPVQKVIKNDRDNLVQQQPQQQVTVQNKIVDKQQPVIKIPEQKQEDIAINEGQVNNTTVKPSNDLPQPLTRTEPADKTATSTPAVENKNYAMPASYIEDAQVKSENYVFYHISAEEFKKSKVGNFLKKVKRVIASKLPLKNNSLKIGNVEIAKDDEN